jgi:predicted glycoside hydrolase/deacetylase ChbG (UPF0249 family)
VGVRRQSGPVDVIAASRSRRVFVCADDFGIAPRTTLAILRLAEARAISAVSVLVDGESAAEQARAVRAMPPEVAVGLHFNLTDRLQGHVTGALGLRLLRTCLIARLDRPRLRAEIERQYERFQQLFGRPPDFIDGHEHVHQLPIVRDAILSAMLARSGRRIAVRATYPRAARGLKAAVIAALGGYALAKELRRRGIATNDDFAGAYDFSTRVPYGVRMRKWLEGISDRGLIMCHPQLADPACPAPAREAEFAYLASDAWRTLLRRQDVTLIPFRA